MPTPVAIKSPSTASNEAAAAKSEPTAKAVDDLPSVPDVPGPAAEPIQPTAAPAPVPAPPAAVPPPESLPPEGPPPAAGTTAPELNLSPKLSALQYPPTEPAYETDADPSSGLNIYQVDIDSLPEKPWRRPGANLSDWFNYGFDESTWAMWCAQKNRMGQARADFSQALQEGPGEGAEEPPCAPPGADDAQNPMANLTAMFAPGMMGMPGMQWPMMMPGAPQGAPSEPMPMMGAPPVEVDGAAPWGAGTHPLPPVPSSAGTADEPRGGADHDGPEGHSGRSRRSGRSGSRSGHGSRRSGRGSGRGDDRSPPRASDGHDDYVPEHHPTASRRDRYNDRDSESAYGGALDYGATAHGDEERRHRRDDDRHAHDDAHRSSRDRPSRRERDRARSDRRAGRGGQKRGAPDVEEHGDHASKRFNGGR